MTRPRGRMPISVYRFLSEYHYLRTRKLNKRVYTAITRCRVLIPRTWRDLPYAYTSIILYRFIGPIMYIMWRSIFQPRVNTTDAQDPLSKLMSCAFATARPFRRSKSLAAPAFNHVSHQRPWRSTEAQDLSSFGIRPKSQIPSRHSKWLPGRAIAQIPTMLLMTAR